MSLSVGQQACHRQTIRPAGELNQTLHFARSHVDTLQSVGPTMKLSYQVLVPVFTMGIYDDYLRWR